MNGKERAKEEKALAKEQVKKKKALAKEQGKEKKALAKLLKKVARQIADTRKLQQKYEHLRERYPSMPLVSFFENKPSVVQAGKAAPQTKKGKSKPIAGLVRSPLKAPHSAPKE